MDYVAACYIETPLGGAKPPGTSAADLIAAGLTQETIKLMIVSGSIVAAEEKPKHRPATVKEEEVRKPAVSKEKWSFDPVSLLNLTVEQLNAKIAEHADGEEIPEIETKEEAIAFLSQDFKS